MKTICQNAAKATVSCEYTSQEKEIMSRTCDEGKCEALSKWSPVETSQASKNYLYALTLGR